MSLETVALAFFAIAAIVLLCLSSHQHRHLLQREQKIEIGMTEADVLSAIGPPHEIRREGEPMDPGYFNEHRRETYVYGDRLLIRFERGVVLGMGEPTPMPEIEAESVLPRSVESRVTGSDSVEERGQGGVPVLTE